MDVKLIPVEVSIPERYGPKGWAFSVTWPSTRMTRYYRTSKKGAGLEECKKHFWWDLQVRFDGCTSSEPLIHGHPVTMPCEWRIKYREGELKWPAGVGEMRRELPRFWRTVQLDIEKR